MGIITAVSERPAELRRSELAAFLRSRRSRISPGDAGLPAGRRRRTAGLRREEVAQLAGVGITWYTWLEQGRPINASAQVLDAVARTLRLDPVEREHLFRLALGPIADGPASHAVALGPQVQQILDQLSPLPASVTTERFDVLAWNRPFQVLHPRVCAAPPGERNSLYACFTKPACCSTYENRDEQRSVLVAQLRAAYAHHLGEPAWTSFIQRMEAVSPEFRSAWASQDVAHPHSLRKVFRHPEFARLPMTSTSMALQNHPGTRLVVYTPDDAETRRALEYLVASSSEKHFPCWSEHQRELAAIGHSS